MAEQAATVYVKNSQRMKITATELNLSLGDMGILMRRVEWAELVKKAEKERLARLQFEADDALRMMIEWASADPADCFDPETNLLHDLHEIPPSTRRWIKTYDRVNNKVVMMEKGTPTTILANKFGINIQRVQADVKLDAVEIVLNSLPVHLRPPGLERRGIRIWDTPVVEAQVVRPSLPEGAQP